MGFDLYSTGKHKNKNGEYFRNNVWHWRRLAEFVCEHTGVVEEEHKKYWQSNDNHEVDGETALQIAKQLRALIKDGITTLGTGYKVNTVMEVLILSQWKMLRTSLSSVKVQMVSQ
jgi:hypothetical protein